MKALGSRIAALRSKLADLASGLALAQRRVAYFKLRAENAENPKNPHPALFERADRRLKYWRNKEHLAYRRRHFLKAHLAIRLKKLARLGPRVENGKVIGGTPLQRIPVLFEHARRHWHPYYSETGAYDEGHALDNAEHDGKRRDCSWDFYESRRACGFKVRRTEPRFTGSALEEGRVVSREYAEQHVGVAVIFGSGKGFHMGTSTGHGPFLWEHGAPDLDIGHYDEFGPGVEVRFRDFPLSQEGAR